ncbi:ABC transporter permease [Actinoplanes palleronii]|uniref:ABC transporter permease n=1 Tax=Actinoplanes palleronii TaxID=113570 RepID=UPI001EF39A6A|nr:hypothetical protein [Actinoplanes palleronii]
MWAVSLAVFCVYYVVGVAAVYPNAADRQNRAAVMSSPGSVIMGGPGYGLEDYTIGAMFANEMAIWLIVLLATMNILMTTRNTRAEEATGRSELVRALPIGRHAASVAAFLVVVIADAIFVVLGSLLLVSLGDLAVADSVALLTGVMLTALVFAGVTTVTCQLTVHGRAASGLAFAALGASILIRGVGDIQEQHGSWLSWVSPVAWTQQMRPYVDLRLWPLGLSVVAVLVMLSLGAFLSTRRDLGGSLLHTRAGRAHATPALASPLALAFRQQRSALLWWFVGCVMMFAPLGVFLGGDAENILNSIADQNSLTAKIFGDDPLAAFFALMLLHCALAVAVFSIASVLRVKPEEDEGRLGLGLSRSASRSTVLLAQLAVAGFGAVLLLFGGGALALWGGARASGGEADLVTLLQGAGAFALGIAVLITFTAALFAWVPKLTALSWVLFGVVVVDSFFGGLFELPAAVSRISPFWWVGDFPTTPLEPSHMIGLGAVAVLLLSLAVAGFRRRDLTAG